MKLKTFFKKFDLFADVPNSVWKMRELVLHLAMQGKVVNQREDDGSAEHLLSVISCERNAPLSKHRTPEKPGLPNDGGYPFQIPSTWAWTQLGNIALQIQYGYTASADPSATEVRMLRITDIQNNRVDWPSVPGCQIEQGEAEKYLLAPNDILIARTGGTIGKSFIVPDAPIKSVFASYLIRVTPPMSIEARFLKIFLESPLYWAQLRAMSAGTGQPNVNGQALGRLQIPLPPLAEQKRIVAKVDELMALCDRLEAQQQERETRRAALARASLARFADTPISANLDFLFHRSYTIAPADLRNSILTLAIQGKLVRQDVNDERARDFLDRTKVRHALPSAGSKSRKTNGTLEIAEDEIPFAIPENWAWCRLETIADKVTDGEHLSPVKTSFGMPLLTATHVTAKGVTLNNPQYVSIEDGNKFRLRCDPMRGDILICSRGTIGRCAVVEMDDVFCLMGSVILVRFPAESSPRYFNYFLSSDLAQTEMRGMSGATAVQALYLKDIRQSLVPIPPLAEQRRIVATVDRLMSLVDQLETQLNASRTKGAELMEAIVAELTNGDILLNSKAA